MRHITPCRPESAITHPSPSLLLSPSIIISHHIVVTTRLIRPRSCLWFGGATAANRLALDEEDVAPPWTAEFWVFRPSCSVAAVSLVARALELRCTFYDLFERMVRRCKG